MKKGLQIQVSDAGDGYVMAECLDIPGCISQGKTPRETLGKLVEAISVCLEVIAEDAAAKAYSEIGPGRYNLSLSASEIQPAA